MKIISLWGPKGGVSKTTLCLNISGGLAAAGYNVLICDKDVDLKKDKEGDLNIMKRLAGEKMLLDVVKEYPKGDVADYLVIDHSPDTTKMPSRNNFMIVPTKASPLDHRRYIKALKKVNGHYGKLIPVISMVDVRYSEDKIYCRDELRVRPETLIVRQRSVYKRTMGRTKSIYEIDPGKMHGIREARAEIDHILERILM